MRSDLSVSEKFKTVSAPVPVDEGMIDTYFADEIYQGDRVDSEGDHSYPIYGEDGNWEDDYERKWNECEFRRQGVVVLDALEGVTAMSAVSAEKLRVYFSAPMAPGELRVAVNSVKAIMETIYFKLARYRAVASEGFAADIVPIVDAINDAEFKCAPGGYGDLQVVLEAVDMVVDRSANSFIYAAKHELIRSIVADFIQSDRGMLLSRYPDSTEEELEGMEKHFAKELMKEIEGEYHLTLTRDCYAEGEVRGFSDYLDGVLSTSEGVEMLRRVVTSNTMSFLPSEEKLDHGYTFYGRSITRIQEALELLPVSAEKKVDSAVILNEDRNGYEVGHAEIVDALALRSLSDAGFVDGALSKFDQLYIAVAMDSEVEVRNLCGGMRVDELCSVISDIDGNDRSVLIAANGWGRDRLINIMLTGQKPVLVMSRLLERAIGSGNGVNVRKAVELAEKYSVLGGCLAVKSPFADMNLLAQYLFRGAAKVEVARELIAAAERIGIAIDFMTEKDGVGSDPLFYSMGLPDGEITKLIVDKLRDRLEAHALKGFLLRSLTNIGGQYYNALTQAADVGNYESINAVLQAVGGSGAIVLVKAIDGDGRTLLGRIVRDQRLMANLFEADDLYYQIFAQTVKPKVIAKSMMSVMEIGLDPAGMLDADLYDNDKKLPLVCDYSDDRGDLLYHALNNDAAGTALSVIRNKLERDVLSESLARLDLEVLNVAIGVVAVKGAEEELNQVIENIPVSRLVEMFRAVNGFVVPLMLTIEGGHVDASVKLIKEKLAVDESVTCCDVLKHHLSHYILDGNYEGVVTSLKIANELEVLEDVVRASTVDEIANGILISLVSGSHNEMLQIVLDEIKEMEHGKILISSKELLAFAIADDNEGTRMIMDNMKYLAADDLFALLNVKGAFAKEDGDEHVGPALIEAIVLKKENIIREIVDLMRDKGITERVIVFTEDPNTEAAMLDCAMVGGSDESLRYIYQALRDNGCDLGAVIDASLERINLHGEILSDEKVQLLNQIRIDALAEVFVESLEGDVSPGSLDHTTSESSQSSDARMLEGVDADSMTSNVDDAEDYGMSAAVAVLNGMSGGSTQVAMPFVGGSPDRKRRLDGTMLAEHNSPLAPWSAGSNKRLCASVSHSSYEGGHDGHANSVDEGRDSSSSLRMDFS